jgi:hypothetical protein
MDGSGFTQYIELGTWFLVQFWKWDSIRVNKSLFQVWFLLTKTTRTNKSNSPNWVLTQHWLTQPPPFNSPPKHSRIQKEKRTPIQSEWIFGGFKEPLSWWMKHPMRSEASKQSPSLSLSMKALLLLVSTVICRSWVTPSVTRGVCHTVALPFTF